MRLRTDAAVIKARNPDGASLIPDHRQTTVILNHLLSAVSFARINSMPSGWLNNLQNGLLRGFRKSARDRAARGRREPQRTAIADIRSLEDRTLLSALVLGDVAFTGYQATAPDKVSFVLLSDISGTTTLTVTDNAWTGSALNTTEGNSVLTINGNFPAGTQFNYDATRTAGSKWAVGVTTTGISDVTGSNFALNASGDNLFAYNGSTAPTTGGSAAWVSAMASNNFLTTGSSTASLTFLPSAFTLGDTAFSLGIANGTANENGALTGPSTISGSAATVRSTVYTVGNWTTFTTANAQAIPPNITFSIGAANLPPTFTSSNTFSVPENTTAVGTVTASDPESATLTYSISGGADAALFAINGTTGELSFLAAPNFEVPTDAGGNNVYDVTVQVSDGTNNVTQAIAVTVTDVNETPTITSGSTYSVQTGNTAVGTVTATDPENTTITYAIVGGVDQAQFTINSVSGALSFLVAPNFATPADDGGNNVYDVTVQASDGTNNAVLAIAVTVTAGVNQPPVITSSATFSVPENTTVVGTVTAADPENDTLVYALAGGADAALFTINGTTGALSFLAAPNFESPSDAGANNVYDVTVQVSDGTSTVTQAVAVTVTDVNEAPAITSAASFSVPENTSAVGTVTATDPESNLLTYSISGGADAALFSINSSTGALTFLVAPNFEAPTDAGANNIYDVTVEVSDGTSSVTQAIAVTVTNVNEPPTITLNRTITLNPNQAVQLSGALLAATDIDTAAASLTYTVTTAPTGTLTKNNIAVTTFKQSDININDTTANAIRYTAGASVGTDSFTLSLSDGTNTLADIVVNVSIVAPTTGVSFTGSNYTQNFDGLLPTPIPNNAQTLPSVSILPQGWTVVESLTNSDSSISIDNGNSGTGDTYLYGTTGSNERALGSYSSGSMTSVYGLALVNNTGATIDNFTLAYIGEQWKNGINGSAVLNQLTFEYSTTATGLTDTPAFTRVAALDFTAPQGGNVGSDVAIDGNLLANQQSISNQVTGITWGAGTTLYLRWTDINDTGNDDGLGIDSLTFSVAASNQPPTITSAATFNAPENTTAVGTVTATDPENATLTYSISGGVDAALFSINSSTGALTFLTAPSFESPTDAGGNNVYDVTVQASDGTNNVTQAIAVTVTDVNEAPTITSAATFNAPENTTAVGTVTATDPENATLTYSISGGVDAALFSINSSTGALTFLTAPSFESPTDAGGNNVYDVTVQASDGTNNVTQAIAVTVTDVNEAPTITSAATFNAPENTTAVGTVTATDPENATLTYSISGGVDAALFSINSSTGALTFLTAPNFESPTDTGGNNIYDVMVQASDGTNSATQAVAVAVSDVNEAPTITSGSSFSVPENTTTVGTVTASDPESQLLTYSISGGADAALFSINSSTGALTFLSAPNFESPTDAGGNNVYDVTVQVSDGTNNVTQAIAVTVTDGNEVPTVTAPIADLTVRQGVAPSTFDLLPIFADSETSDLNLSYTISANSNPSLFSSIQVVDGQLTLTYDPTKFGTSTITVRATDPGLLFAEETFVVTVNYTLQLLHLSDGEAGLLASSTASNLAALVDAFDNDYNQTLTLAGGDNWISGAFLAGGTDASVRTVLNAVSGSTIAAGTAIPIAAVDIAIHNELGVEASTIGNHEFDLGSRVFRDSFSPNLGAAGWVGANFPYVSANLDFSGDADLSSRFTNTLDGGTGTLVPDASTLKGRIAPSVVLNKGGQKIGIVAATTQLLEAISSPSGTEVKGFPNGPGPNGEFDDMALLASHLQPVINELLAEGVNKIVLMSHLQVLANEQALAGLLSGVDIILAGGSNTRLGDADDVPVSFPGHSADFANTYPLLTSGTDGKPTLIVNTDGEYTYLGRLVIDFNDAGELNVASLSELTSINGAYAATLANVEAAWTGEGGLAAAFAEGTKGEEVADLTDAVQAVIAAKDGNVAGFTNVYLQGERIAVRNEETNLGNLSADANADALRTALGATAPTTFIASLKNGGGIRAQIGTVSDPDPVTGEVDLLPPAANPSVSKPAGGVSQLDIENALRFNNTLMAFDTTAAGLKAILEHGVALLGNQGRFPQIGGVRFSFNPSAAAGSRISNIALIDENDNVIAAIVENGVVSPTAPSTITVVTLGFLANGGDSYPIKANATNFRYLLTDGTLSASVDSALDFTAAANVPANVLAEQATLFDYLQSRYGTAGTAYNVAETPRTLDTRIQNLSVRSDAVFPPNAPPSIALQNSVTVIAENTSTASAIKVADIVVTDDVLGSNTLSLTGTDATFFEIVGTELRLKAGTVLDFENKTSYTVTVNVDDATVGSTPDGSVVYTLSVTDVNEAPTITNGNIVSVPENTTTVGTVTASDPESQLLTYSISGGVDAGLFSINSSTGGLTFLSAPNFESPTDAGGNNVYDVTVQVSDGLNNVTQAIAVTVTDVNEAPTAVVLTPVAASLPEDTSTASAVNVTSIAVTDDALGTNVLTLSGADAAAFEIQGTTLRLKAGTTLDFETKATYTVIVNVDDASVGTTPDASTTFTLTLTDVLEAPEIEVQQSGNNVVDGGSVSLGAVTTGTASTRIFTVRNTGNAPLILQPISITGSDFTVTSGNFTAGQILAVNATASFTVTMNTASAGTKSGSLSFVNNDGNENPFNFGLAGNVMATGAVPIVIDDGDAGFALTGTWANVAGYGFGSDAKAATGSDGTKRATWTFTGLTAGTYQIDASWLPGTDRAANAPYTIRDGVGGTVLSNVAVNQKNAPAGAVSQGGRPFFMLGTVTITGDTLVVELANSLTNGAIIADAMRIVSMAPAPDTPEIDVREGTLTLADGSNSSFGDVTQGAAITKTFTVRNTGTGDLVLQPITVTGAAFSLVSTNFTPGQILAPNSEVTITVAMNTTTVGTFTGGLSFGNSDANEGAFDLSFTGKVNPPSPTTMIIDDGDAGFSLAGTWNNVPGYGFGSDAKAATGNTGTKIATWNFTGLANGTYQIDASWLSGTDRANNAPYTFSDGLGGSLGNATINQRLNPTGAPSAGGRPFGTIGTVVVTNGVLVVQLSNTATNGAIIADAMRLTRIA